MRSMKAFWQLKMQDFETEMSIFQKMSDETTVIGSNWVVNVERAVLLAKKLIILDVVKWRRHSVLLTFAFGNQKTAFIFLGTKSHVSSLGIVPLLL